jgi:nucleoside-diphosphate-sugar epimerase
MPSVQAPAKVLVSGTNGYVAIWVVQNLLSKGYSVCGTVRSAEKDEHLKKLFTNFGDKHEVIIVSDITKVSPASTYMIRPLEQQAHRKKLLTRL